MDCFGLGVTDVAELFFVDYEHEQIRVGHVTRQQCHFEY